MGNFAENLNLGKHVPPPPWRIQGEYTSIRYRNYGTQNDILLPFCTTIIREINCFKHFSK